ncbi:hypothetical protein T484DRAFT_1780684 [Baffinella frigidus]|nr:hypothetical protein T484DRAFT_1780684 [Cryptophyta sp. CCMP2293]
MQRAGGAPLGLRTANLPPGGRGHSTNPAVESPLPNFSALPVPTTSFRMTTAREGGPQAPILLTPAHRALQHRPGAAPEPAAPSGGDDGFGHASGSESSNSGWRAAGAWDLAEAVATSGQWRKDGATEAVRAMAAQWASLRGARREAVEQAGEVARRVVDDARHHRDASLLAGEQSKRAAAAVLSSSAHTPPVNAPQHSGGEARADEPGGQRIMENGRRRNRGPNARRGPGVRP